MLNLATQINRRINYLAKYHPPSQSNTRIDNSANLLKVYGGQSAEEALNRLIETAERAGLPKDSLSRFLRAGYVPQPMQVRFHAAARSCDEPGGPNQVGNGGARGPGKSHCVFAQTALDDCQRFPGLKVLYLRKIQKNAKEQFEDLRISVLRYTAHRFANGILYFDNGSRAFVGHFRNESDIDNYLGIEYDLIVIEEATTLSVSKYRALNDSNRTSKSGWRPRIYATTNPGGVGHAWFKETFIVPARTEQETETRFIFGTAEDNVFNDPDYIPKLEKNTGWKLRAYRYGDWDIAAGQYFTNWHYDSHVVEPFVVPFQWPAWASFDYGYTHPTVVYLLREFDGTIYVTAEYREAKKVPAIHAPAIKELFLSQGLDIARVKPFVAGADTFDQKGDEHARTVAQQYEALGIHLERAQMSRISRAGELLMRLGDVHAEKRIEPTIKIFNTCTHLIDCIPALQHDPHRPEDVLKWDVDEDGNGGDDPYDSLGMGLLVKKRQDRYSESESPTWSYQSY